MSPSSCPRATPRSRSCTAWRSTSTARRSCRSRSRARTAPPICAWPKRWRRRSHALGPQTIGEVTYDIRAEQAFFGGRKLLYAPLEDLEALRDALRAEIGRRKNPLLVDVLGEDDVDTVVARMKKRSAGFNPFPSGYFEADEGRLVVIVCRPPGGLFAERAGERLAAETRRLIDELSPHSFHPSMKVGLTGDVMSQLEERAALENDLVWATGLCVSLVLIVVVRLLRPARARCPSCASRRCSACRSRSARRSSCSATSTLRPPSWARSSSATASTSRSSLLARYEEERRARHDARRCRRDRPRRHSAAHGDRRARRRDCLRVADGDALPRLLAVRRHRWRSAWSRRGCATVTILPALLALFDRHAAQRPRRFAPPGTAFSEHGLAHRHPRATRLRLAVRGLHDRRADPAAPLPP